MPHYTIIFSESRTCLYFSKWPFLYPDETVVSFCVTIPMKGCLICKHHSSLKITTVLSCIPHKTCKFNSCVLILYLSFHVKCKFFMPVTLTSCRRYESSFGYTQLQTANSNYLRWQDSIMLSTFFSDVSGRPDDLSFSTFPLSTNWLNQRRIALSTGRPLPRATRKLRCTFAMYLLSHKLIADGVFPCTLAIALNCDSGKAYDSSFSRMRTEQRDECALL